MLGNEALTEISAVPLLGRVSFETYTEGLKMEGDVCRTICELLEADL